VGKRRFGWLAKPNRWNVNGAEEAGRNCGTGRAVVPAGAGANHPWHRRDTGDGRPPMLNEGDIGRCEPEEVSSMETANDKERAEQRYG
jgi:hypothetical protein